MALDARMKKMIVMTIARSSKPIVLSAGLLVPLDINTLLQVSDFDLIENIDDKIYFVFRS